MNITIAANREIKSPESDQLYEYRGIYKLFKVTLYSIRFEKAKYRPFGFY